MLRHTPIALFLTVLSFFTFSCRYAEAGPAASQPQKENLSFEDAMIAASFKSLAKAFIAVQDKAELAKRLRSMDEERFQKRYARVYGVIKHSPLLLQKYGFREGMSAGELADKLDSWDKHKLSSIVDGIPDSAIASEFKKYVSGESRDARNADTGEQISWVWNRVSRELGAKAK